MNNMSSSAYMFNQTADQDVPPFFSRSGSTSDSSLEEDQRKEYPVYLLHACPDRSNSDHIKMFKAVLDQIRIVGYDECFGHGKKEKFYRSIYDKAFKPDGIFNEYKKPVYTRVRTSIVQGLKFLSSILNNAHSPGVASDGEAYPPHLAVVLTLLKKINETAPEPNPTISQQNRTMQNKIIGDRSPLGSNPNATPRASTRAENERNGLALAERSGTCGALSESSDNQSAATQRSSKRPSNAISPDAMLSDWTEARKETTNIMNNINNTILSHQPHHTASISFQQRMLDAKVQLAREKLEFKKEALEREDRFRQEDRERENNTAVTELLREAYNQAKEDLKEIDKNKDPDLYEGAKDLLKVAQKQYITHIKNLSKRTEIQAPPSFTRSYQAPPIFNRITISSSAPNTPRPNTESIQYQSVQQTSDITRGTTVVNVLDDSSNNEHEHEHEHDEVNENHHLPV